MYQPYSLAKMYTHIQKPKKRIPKTLLLFFFVLNVVFGYDFGFLKLLPRKLQPLATLISLSITLLCVFILGMPFKEFVGDTYVYTLNFGRYVCFVIVLKFTNFTLYDFIRGIYNLDEYMFRINQELIGVVTWLYFLIVYMSKYFIYYAFCSMYEHACDADFIPYYIFFIPSMGVDTVSIILILIYYYIHCCVKYLNYILKEGIDIKTLKKHYIAIADCYENIKPLYGRLLVFQLLYDIPEMMAMMWHVLRNIQEERGWLTCVGEYVFAFHIMSHIIYAAIAVQMVVSQVDALIVKLNNILVDEHDMKKHDEISRLLQLMSARRLRHDVLGVIPTDLGLPVSVISLCITYLIVVVQFTHLYD